MTRRIKFLRDELFFVEMEIGKVVTCRGAGWGILFAYLSADLLHGWEWRGVGSMHDEACMCFLLRAS